MLFPACTIRELISYGPQPQTIAIYDRIVEAKSVDYWNGSLTLDPNTLEYVRGEKRFRNPSNYGLVALPVGLPKWRNRILHFELRVQSAVTFNRSAKVGA